jgi:hypothetical protein
LIARRAVAVLLALHGIVHLIGFLVPWRLMATPEFPYTTTAAWGVLELGDAGTRFVGLLMLGLAGGFVVAAIGVWRRAPWAVPVTVGVAVVSLVACVLQSPAAILGVAIDLVILAAVGLTRLRAEGQHPTPRAARS